jgi:hypothetical protein
MNCPEVQELFSDYLDDRLAPSQASLLKEHLGTCAACRLELEGLRQTIELIGSVEEMKTSPDFLAQVDRKIDGGSAMSPLWRWVFTPAKIKIPLEAAALATVVVFAVYLYRSSDLSQEDFPFTKKSPEKSEETSRRAESDPGGQAQDSRMILAYKKLGRKEAPPAVSGALPGKETPASPAQRPAQPAPPELSDLAAGTAEKGESSGASPARAGRGALPAAPSPQVVKVKSEDLGLFQRRIREMLTNVTGRVISEQASEEGLLLAVELPESREEEFRAALRKEYGLDSSPTYASKEKAKASAFGVAQRNLMEKRKSAPEKDEPPAQIELRIWAKK